MDTCGSHRVQCKNKKQKQKKIITCLMSSKCPEHSLVQSDVNTMFLLKISTADYLPTAACMLRKQDQQERDTAACLGSPASCCVQANSERRRQTAAIVTLFETLQYLLIRKCLNISIERRSDFTVCVTPVGYSGYFFFY